MLRKTAGFHTMGIALIKIKIMPEGVDTDLEAIKEKSKSILSTIGGEITKFEEEPIAFGLKALIVFIRIDEKTDSSAIEEPFNKLENISSAEIIDYRREL